MSPAGRLSDDEAVAALEQATDALFYRKGVAAVTVADVRDESGLSLRRIYRLCPSKADLVSLWLRSRHRAWTATFRSSVEEGLADGRSAVDAVFDAVEAWMTNTGFRGCAFINTHAESSELTDEHRRIIQDHKRTLASYLDQHTGHGKALAVLVDGAIIQAALFESVEPIGQSRRAAHALVGPPR